MDKNFEKNYHRLEKRHFWFRARRDYILNELKGLDRNARILDIGCSSGILLLELQEMGFKNENLFGIDISKEAIENCHSNDLKNTWVMDAQNITIPEKFDVLIASDCLEHLEQDQKALANWHSLLKKDGLLIVFVPAFMSLWSAHDVANMHYRRYTNRQLRNKLQSSQFKTERTGYWNFILFPPIWAVRVLGRLLKEGKGKSDGDLSSLGLFNGLLYGLMSMENFVLRFIRVPFGVSTFCIARRS